MSRIPFQYGVLAPVLLFPFMLSLAGCGTSTTKDGPTATPAAASAAEADADASAELAKLPPKDRALAEKQKVCPVTDAPLGSMGVPCKVTLKGRAVFLCCGGCEDELDQNADKYLAKLDRAEGK